MYDFFTQWYGIASLAVLLIILFGDEIIGLFKRFAFKDVDDELNYNNINDLRQSEHVEVAREKEFEVIITNLEETEE